MIPFIADTTEKLKATRMGRLFLNKKFFHYTWIGILVSTINIFCLWLFIDVFGIPTIISSIAVIGTTFVLRYILFRGFEAI